MCCSVNSGVAGRRGLVVLGSDIHTVEICSKIKVGYCDADCD